MKSELVALTLTVVALASCSQSSTSSTTQPSQKIEPLKPPPAVTVNGQVFVVTRGRDNIKLALVDVQAIPENMIASFIEERHKLGTEQQKVLLPALRVALGESNQAQAASKVADAKMSASTGGDTDAFLKSVDQFQNSSDRARKKRSAWMTLNSEFTAFSEPAYYFAALPTAVSTAKTDADGRFSLSVPAGRYVLAASTSRKVFRDSEHYFWLVHVDATRPINGLMLSNDNQLSTKCKECIKLPE